MTRYFPQTDYDEEGDFPQEVRQVSPRIPLVRTLEATGLWENENTWGTTFTNVWPGQGAKLQLIQKVNFPGPPRPRGLYLTRGTPDLQLQGGDVKAQITWGVGGFRFTALTDWSNGQTLIIPGGAITVEALTLPTFQATVINPTKGTARDFKLGAMFTDSLPTEHTARLTQSYSSFSTSDQIDVLIPEFATGVRIYQPELDFTAGDAISYQWWGPLLAFDRVGSFTGRQVFDSNGSAFPVPGTATYLRISGTQITTSGALSLIWDLSL